MYVTFRVKEKYTKYTADAALTFEFLQKYDYFLKIPFAETFPLFQFNLFFILLTFSCFMKIKKKSKSDKIEESVNMSFSLQCLIG